jgi:RNA polymerase sigma-70 factor, ECF subfamily
VNLSSLDDNSLMGIIAAREGEPARAEGLRRHSEAELPSEALGALYDRYGRLVFTVAIHVVGDSETAEEITQDVFVRVWEGARTYRSDLAKVSSWLISIARHRAIDELRRRGIRPEKDSSGWPEDVGLDHLDGLPLWDGPEETVESHLQHQNIRKVIATLPTDQREVLGLAYFKGLSHSQIAEQLDEPLGTVKSRIRQAMQKIRDTLIERGMVDL